MRGLCLGSKGDNCWRDLNHGSLGDSLRTYEHEIWYTIPIICNRNELLYKINLCQTFQIPNTWTKFSRERHKGTSKFLLKFQLKIEQKS